MNIAQRGVGQFREWVRIKFGLRIVATTEIEYPDAPYAITVNDYHMAHSHDYDRHHYVNHNSLFWKGHCPLALELVDEDIFYAVTDEGIYAFTSYRDAAKARELVLDHLIETGDCFMPWPPQNESRIPSYQRPMIE